MVLAEVDYKYYSFLPKSVSRAKSLKSLRADSNYTTIAWHFTKNWRNYPAQFRNFCHKATQKVNGFGDNNPSAFLLST
jgi:hypothetical protein